MSHAPVPDSRRIVITGVGLTSPLGDTPAELRAGLLAGKPRVEMYTPRYMPPCPAGRCHFPVEKHQSRKEARRGTRAGSITVYCGHEALAGAGLVPGADGGPDRSRVGVYVGLTEHGNAEFETEWANLAEFGNDVKYWSHHHNPRTVLNSPAGEFCLNAGLTGPHLSVGAACAAGVCGVVHAAQQLILGEVDVAIGGGVSEAMHFGIFASFAAQNALARSDDPNRASRPFDRGRNGIVIAEGGALFVLERRDDSLRRGAEILGEILGWGLNTDATDFVLPNAERQAECMALALARAGMEPGELDLLNAHVTATPEGDPKEVEAIRRVFGDNGPAHVNATKGFWGHAMGAAGALGLAGNLGGFADGMVHPTVNLADPDPACWLPSIVANEAIAARRPIRTFMVNAFGMLGINASVIVGGAGSAEC